VSPEILSVEGSLHTGKEIIRRAPKNMFSNQSKVILASIVLHIIATAPHVTAQRGVVQIETSLVSLNVFFTDGQGRRTGGLRKEDVEVYDDAAEQEITHFTERPVRLDLVCSCGLEHAISISAC
jgi:hypothetical protein